MKTYDNYLFDLYGTLVDIHTDEDDLVLWQQMCVLLSMDGIAFTPEELRKQFRFTVEALEQNTRKESGSGIEIDIRDVFASFCPSYVKAPNDAHIDHLAHIFRILSTHKLRLYPGVSRMLQELKQRGKKLFLLSNAQAVFTLPELQALDLERYFDGIIISSSEGFKKPDLRFYQLAMKRYQLMAQNTVMVGNDDVADCWGAANAGMDSYYINTEQSPVREKELPVNSVELKQITDLLFMVRSSD